VRTSWPDGRLGRARRAYDRAMPRLRLLAAGAFLLLLLLMVPALALAKVKRGTYIEAKTQTYIVTNAAATKIKSLNIPCIVNAEQSGGNLITKSLKINAGKFSFDGKSTLRSTSNSVIKIKVTGKFANNKITGTISYPGTPTSCTNRTFSAKFYGVNPQG
jgi:hypothetical protein